MELTPEQTATLAAWVAEGVPLADIQSRIREEFDQALTYMEVRFLVDDLDLEMPAPAPEPEPEPEPVPEPAPEASAGETGDDPGAQAAGGGAPDPPSGDLPGPDAAGGVTLEVDSVTVPGTVVSGSVTFSDGETAKWYIDPFGQPGLVPPHEGYQPSREDVEAFQVELTNVLRKRGF